MSQVRKLALEIINEVLNQGAYSNLILDEKIRTHDLNAQDVGLLTELVYGTIQYKLTLDYYLKDYIENKKMKKDIRNLLRMSVYQKLYLDKIPDYAIINEAVNIAKKRNENAGRFVNAVLRNFLRNGVKSLDEIKDKEERLSIETSHPLWLVKMWSKQFSFDIAKKVCLLNNKRPPLFARLNLYKEKKEVILQKLTDLSIEYVLTPLDCGIIIENTNIASTTLFQEGYLTVQDLSSMVVTKILQPKENEKILDACAAPGGKTTHIAEMMKNTGSVYACDIFSHKINLIEHNSKRLGLQNIKATLLDARELTKEFPEDYFDRVLVDAPCTGFGVVRRKPEIKYNRNPRDLDKIIALQKEIVDETIQTVKKGGTFVYSTCTIGKKENEKMVDYILDKYPEFSLNSKPFEELGLENKGFVQLIDKIEGGDIFFISCFVRNKT